MRHLKRFGTVASVVVRCPELSTTAKALYSVLCSFAGDKSCCYPSQENLAFSLNVSVRTVQAAIKELSNKGVITVQRANGRGTGRNSNMYFLFDKVRGWEDEDL